jgi:hypothetical protein
LADARADKDLSNPPQKVIRNCFYGLEGRRRVFEISEEPLEASIIFRTMVSEMERSIDRLWRRKISLFGLGAFQHARDASTSPLVLPGRNIDVPAALQGPLSHACHCCGVTKSSVHAVSLGLFAVCGEDTLVFQPQLVPRSILIPKLLNAWSLPLSLLKYVL